jgi:cytosine/adenosine deaminase-related metal-dependent hydrolase
MAERAGVSSVMSVRVVHADAVVTGDDGVVRDGAIALDANGVVLDVGAASDVLPRHAGAVLERVRGVLFPALVNAHTHLELSALRGCVPGGAGFVPWVERLIGARSEAQPEDDAAAVERAVAELDAAGTGAVGEVTNSLAAVRPLMRAGFAGCVFHEFFGVKRDVAWAKLDALTTERASAVGEWPSRDLEWCPSPHTLYTTHRDAVARVFAEARAASRRVSVHVAEHSAERRALESGDGPVAEWYERQLKLGPNEVSWPLLSPIAFAAKLGALAPNVLLVHLTDARPAELAQVAESGASVVLCPRSNLHIETKLPPLLAMRSAGIEAALGTDSLASNASLDVLAEARALRDRFTSVPASELLRMATWNGARALGRRDLGRFAKGARPGVVAVLGEPGDDPAAWLLSETRAPRRWIARRQADQNEEEVSS